MSQSSPSLPVMRCSPPPGLLLAGLLLLPALVADDPPPASAAPAVRAGALYNTHCSGCHGKDGRARTPMAKQLGVRDLTLSKTTDAEILKQIREGKQAPDGKTLMPAFEKRLTAEEQQLLLDRVKAFRKPAPPQR